MKITVDGTVYEWDPSRMLYREASFLQRKLGMKLQEWNKALQNEDIDAVAGLVFLLRQRAGEEPNWDNLDFDINSLAYEAGDDEVETDPAPKEGAPVGA